MSVGVIAGLSLVNAQFPLGQLATRASRGRLLDWTAEGLWDDSAVQTARNESIAARIRESGAVARPRSCASSTLMACASISHSVPLLAERGLSPSRCGIVVVTTTSTPQVTLDYELRACQEGWDRANPLLVPATIPSAIATHASATIGAKAFALTLLDGSTGVIDALLLAEWSLRSDRCDACLIIAVDEVSEIQACAWEALGKRRVMKPGAVTLLVVRPNENGWRYQHVPVSRPTERKREAPGIESALVLASRLVSGLAVDDSFVLQSGDESVGYGCRVWIDA